MSAGLRRLALVFVCALLALGLSAPRRLGPVHGDAHPRPERRHPGRRVAEPRHGPDLRRLSFRSGLDSPDQMVINLPPGLLADAAIDGGACLTTVDLSDSDCQVGTGTVTSDCSTTCRWCLRSPIALPVTFDLVPPPAAGDLAGLAVNYEGAQIGSTAAIKVRPSGDPDGVGITIDFVLPNSLTLPDSLGGVPIAITEIDSTFEGLRYPTSCPSTPAGLDVSVNSYDDPTFQDLSQPLSVTGCAALPYSPQLTVSATKDRRDRSVSVAAVITQAADEAATGDVPGLHRADARREPRIDQSSLRRMSPLGRCTPVGTATAVSPLYPEPLVANAYLTGDRAARL